LLERYRKFSRTWPQGSARETASGFWIVSLPNVSLDVARDEKQARAMLEAFQGEY
jgi:hypothetical protein